MATTKPSQNITLDTSYEHSTASWLSHALSRRDVSAATLNSAAPVPLRYSIARKRNSSPCTESNEALTITSGS